MKNLTDAVGGKFIGPAAKFKKNICKQYKKIFSKLKKSQDLKKMNYRFLIMIKLLYKNW